MYIANEDALPNYAHNEVAEHQFRSSYSIVYRSLSFQTSNSPRVT